MVDVTGATKTADFRAQRDWGRRGGARARVVACLLSTFGVGVLGCAPLLFAEPAGAQPPPPHESPMNALTDAEREAGWKLLFDGHSTEGWRGYMMSGVPDGWRVLDGELTLVEPGRDVITR